MNCVHMGPLQLENKHFLMGSYFVVVHFLTFQMHLKNKLLTAFVHKMCVMVDINLFLNKKITPFVQKSKEKKSKTDVFV